MKRAKNKFEFGTDFQQLILQYTVTDPKGFKVLDYYDDSYFDLIQHSVIAHALKKYYKKNKHIPDEVFFREFLRVQYQTDQKTFRDLSPTDRETVSNTIAVIYAKPVSNPQKIVEKCINFARFVNFKEKLESVDMNNYDSWEAAIKDLNKANSIGQEVLKVSEEIFLFRDFPDRMHKRDTIAPATPTPFWQLNNLLNSGGTEVGNVFCFLSKEKVGKTVALINVTKGYLRLRKKVLYIDTENGAHLIATRSEQSLARKDQKTITSGEHDDKLAKLFRKYKRIGSEMVIKKVPGLITTADDIERLIDKLAQEENLVIDVLVLDYILLMGAISGKEDDFNRISDATIDLKNMATRKNLQAVWTAAHVVRGAYKRYSSKFNSDDIAKCIDIPRSVDAVIGIQQNEEEEEAGVWRWEIIAQRNGMKDGKMFFWVDIETQNVTEFNKKEVMNYRKESGEEDKDPKERMKERKKKSDL